METLLSAFANLWVFLWSHVRFFAQSCRQVFEEDVADCGIHRQLLKQGGKIGSVMTKTSYGRFSHATGSLQSASLLGNEPEQFAQGFAPRPINRAQQSAAKSIKNATMDSTTSGTKRRMCSSIAPQRMRKPSANFLYNSEQD